MKFKRYVESAMDVLKDGVKDATAAFVMTALLASPIAADAQARQRPSQIQIAAPRRGAVQVAQPPTIYQERATARTATAAPRSAAAVSRSSGTAAPRLARPNEWNRYTSMRRDDRFFSVNVFYYSGSPFGINDIIPYYWNGGAFIPGRFYGNFWSPITCLPRMLTQWDAIEAQWYNVYGSKFGPTMGDLKSMRYNAVAMRAGIPYGYEAQQQFVENPVNEQLARENEQLRKENEELRLREAEQRGYERGRSEAGQQTVQNDRIKLAIEYGGNVAKVQYAGVAKDYYNFGLFESLRRVSDGDINLTAYVEGVYSLIIRDGNNEMSDLARINMARYPGCMNINNLLNELTSEIPNAIEIDNAKVYAARAGVDINFNLNYPDPCRQ